MDADEFILITLDFGIGVATMFVAIIIGTMVGLL